MEKPSEAATYTHGHHASVLRAHAWRTAKNSAAYLLPRLTPSMSILDIGCGAGTITVDLANYVSESRVVGLDRTSEVLDQARSTAEQLHISNVEFVTGDANALDYVDASFDVVHCHQVLQHVRDPVGVLREMRRVAKSGGLVAARDADYGGFIWYPDTKGLREWLDLYRSVARFNGGELDAGRRLHFWAKEAGFAPGSVKCSTSSWCFSTPDEIRDFSESWAERTVGSSFAKAAVEGGHATKEELERLAGAWREWAGHPDAWFSIPHGEIVCEKG